MWQRILQGGSGGSSESVDLAFASFSHSNQGAYVTLNINGTGQGVSLRDYHTSGTTELFEVKRGTTTYTFTFLKEVYLYDGIDNLSKKYGIGETYSYTGSNFSKILVFALFS